MGKALRESELQADWRNVPRGWDAHFSTVWLGLDHSFAWHSGKPNPHPIIFETMVFSPGKEKSGVTGREYSEDWDIERYETEAEAIAGHDAMVRKWKRIREAWKNGGLVPEDAPAIVQGQEYQSQLVLS